ncbi:helix-turn-helix transcriptional regulator [Oceanicella sp. SM1341]|uniref:helix-turn-helix transcriptional regulator n=1 Tax=Oceanicella sp. SM1341 TaxID=1548889 RepID=UPI000E52E2B9|nr:helix-turn-helix transcriptional regulator [Oceanicella sp. SM1341]
MDGTDSSGTRRQEPATGDRAASEAPGPKANPASGSAPPTEPGKALGAFLRDRRARLDPAAFGLPLTRRRTPGLRREELAQRAHVSATWYTWLEQGRGGAPSADVLERLARALALTEEEREHMFLLAQARPPQVRPGPPTGLPPRLRQVLDAFGDTPAVVKTPDWTVLAWNRAATAIFADFTALPATGRNVLRMLFRRPAATRLDDWESVARHVVGSVRRDTLRAGLQEETRALVEALSAESPEFRAMWAEQEVHVHGEGHKSIDAPGVGRVRMDYSTFSVDGRPELGLVVFLPATAQDRARLDALIAALPPETG